MAFTDFILKHFWSPGYTLVNTLTYAVILFFCVYAIIEVFRKFNFKLDRRFFLATIPFIFFGGTARELVDRGFGIYPGYASYPANFFVVAPGIFLTMFVLTGIVLVVSVLLLREKYHLGMFSVGVVLSSYNLFLILTHVSDLRGLSLALLVFALSVVLCLLILRKWERVLFLRCEPFYVNFSVLAAHLLDASATYVGIDYLGFREKHVLPNFLIDNVGSAIVMFPLKVFVVCLVLYTLDREYESDDLSRIFIKFVVLILGLGPALRDLTLIALG
ncbi:MAG: DUF63 family protein [Methanobacteriota archaeon]